VLLITIDTLRADHVGCYGYRCARTPNMDRLASEGVLFEQVGAQVPVTLPSHATILTGLTPATHGVHNNSTFSLSDTVQTLAEMLGRRGYQTGAVLGAYVLAGQFGLRQGFSSYDDEFSEVDGVASGASFAERPASEVARRGVEWLRGHTGEPFFLWLHFFDPHRPYDPPGRYAKVFGECPYDGEVAYVDEEIGRVLAHLAAEELDATTLVVVTSDHGEGLGEHDEESHSHFLYESTMRVPFIIRCPGTLPAGVRVAGVVRTVDIAPTVLGFLGLPSPEWMEGRDVSVTAGGERSGDMVSMGETLVPLYDFGFSPLVSVRTDRWKYVASPRAELYDLIDDPAETLNVVGAHPAVAESLSVLAGRYADRMLGGGTDGVMLSEEQRDRLAALGYLSSPPRSVPHISRWGELPDPKDHARVMALTGDAADHLAVGRVAEGLALVEEARAEAPSLPLLNLLEGAALFGAGRLDEAAATLRDGMLRDSSYVRFPVLLGNVELARGNYREAARALQHALRLVPFDPWTLYLHGTALLGTGNVRAAVVSLEAAVRSQPSFGEARFQLARVLLSVGEPDSALGHARLAAEYCSQSADAHVLLGSCYEAVGRWREAASSYREAIRADPTRAAVYTRMSFCYHRAGMDDEAARGLEEHLERFGEDAQVLSLLAGQKLAGGDTVGAVSTWEHATAIDSTAGTAWAGLVSVAAVRGDTALAASLVARGLEACPGDSILAALAATLGRETAE
jgi:choline-sulfatase